MPNLANYHSLLIPFLLYLVANSLQVVAFLAFDWPEPVAEVFVPGSARNGPLQLCTVM